MPCYHPVDIWISRPSIENGFKREVVHNYDVRYHYDFDYATRPCKHCFGCRLEYSRQWAIRICHETSLYSSNCFITLTFDNLNLPPDRSLKVEHFQDFMKALRHRFIGLDTVKHYKAGKLNRHGKFYPEFHNPIRFYHSGEYGEQFNRPHYHAALFNFDFVDKYHWRTSKRGDLIWRSPSLEELWPYGNSEIGSVTFESAAYIAGYIMKKINGKKAQDHYYWVDPATGQIFTLKPEYCTMSRMPGLGRGWYDQFKSDVYPHDEVVLRGRKMKPPKYYDNILRVESPFDYDDILFERHKRAILHADDNSRDRLDAKAEVAMSKYRQRQLWSANNGS